MVPERHMVKASTAATPATAAPMPKKLLKQNDFVLKACKDKKIPYVDYLIYRKGYVLSKEDQNFIECLKNVIEQVK